MSVLLCYFYYIYTTIEFLPSLLSLYYFLFSLLYKVLLNCQLKISLKKQVVLDNINKILQNQESAHFSICSPEV